MTDILLGIGIGAVAMSLWRFGVWLKDAWQRRQWRKAAAAARWPEPQ